jgi:hypothetical protein
VARNAQPSPLPLVKAPGLLTYLTIEDGFPTQIQNACEAGIWNLEYDFDGTYGQQAMDSGGIAGAVARILAQPTVESAYARFYPSSSTNPLLAGLMPFRPFGCALENLTAASYTDCVCGR